MDKERFQGAGPKKKRREGRRGVYGMVSTWVKRRKKGGERMPQYVPIRNVGGGKKKIRSFGLVGFPDGDREDRYIHHFRKSDQGEF